MKIIQESVKVPISQVENWEDNPKAIQAKDFERLKRQIKKFGLYKPLLVFKENGKYKVVGGNMRLLALKELGQTEVWITEVTFKSEVEKIELSLSDNDRAGYYQDDILAELILPYQSDLDLQDYKVDLEMPKIDLANVLDFFGPGGEMKIDEKEVDENLETEYTCPKCGHKFS